MPAAAGTRPVGSVFETPWKSLWVTKATPMIPSRVESGEGEAAVDEEAFSSFLAAAAAAGATVECASQIAAAAEGALSPALGHPCSVAATTACGARAPLSAPTRTPTILLGASAARSACSSDRRRRSEKCRIGGSSWRRGGRGEELALLLGSWLGAIGVE